MTILVLDPSRSRVSEFLPRALVRGYQAAVVTSVDEASAALARNAVTTFLIRDLEASEIEPSWVHGLLAQHAELRILIVSPGPETRRMLQHARVLVVWDDEPDDILRELSAVAILAFLPLGEESAAPVLDLAELKRAYAAQLPGQLRALAQAVEDARRGSKPLDVARYLAHRMRGSAASYGFGELGRVAGELEARIVVAFDSLSVADDDWRALHEILRRLDDVQQYPLASG